MLEIWNSPGFIRYVGDRGIRNLDQARQALSGGILRQYANSGFGPYRVALKDDTPVGICGLFVRDELDGVPDLGYALLPHCTGKGYAIEAATLAVAHADHRLELPLLYAIVSPDNSASIALLDKVGMRYEKKIEMHGDDTLLYSRARPTGDSG